MKNIVNKKKYKTAIDNVVKIYILLAEIEFFWNENDSGNSHPMAEHHSNYILMRFDFDIYCNILMR